MDYKLYTNLDAQGGLPLKQAAEQGAKIYVPEGSVLTDPDDRAPTIEEINKILDYQDRRIKAIICTMASSGIRVGAWDFLKWKHIIPIQKNGQVIAAKLIVYAGD
jgi:hypothetical protein